MRGVCAAVIAFAIAGLTGSGAHAAATEKVLYAFKGAADGATPHAGLIADSDGNLYGTAEAGGSKAGCSHGCGVVFKLSPPAVSGGKWTETVLHAFKSGTDGAIPLGGLVFDANGTLYGTTSAGGKLSGCTGGCGIVFKLTPPAGGGKLWPEKVLYNFTGTAGGDSPQAGLIVDSSGTLYGTTGQSSAGTSACLGSPCGTVFKLTPPVAGHNLWTYTLLHKFTGGTDGSLPLGALVADEDGALYGTTALGGNNHCFNFGCGAVFRLTPPTAGKTVWKESVIYAFTGNSTLGGTTDDGAYPGSDLAIDANGILYGTTSIGGGATSSSCAGTGCGVVFKLTRPAGAVKTGVESVLYSFQGGQRGAGPLTGGLILGAKGALFGTTPMGGSGCKTCGIVFELNPPSPTGGDWKEGLLHSFQGGTDGAVPQAGLVQIGNSFYGTTSAGGAKNFGTVFAVTR